MIDISDEKALTKYLLDKQVINETDGYSFHYCNGGVSCTVAFVYAGDRELIIKQGLARLKVREVWNCDPNRMYIEYESNRIYHNLMPNCASPVYFYDGDNYIYGRKAVPESWHMWKNDLLEGVLNFNAAERVINTLVTVHNYCATDEKIAEMFDSKDIFYNLRVSPYIEFVVQKYPQLDSYAKTIIDFLMNTKCTLVHGDFSPKNIMTDGREICILDYEVAHYGHPAFDLAFFSTHFILKAVKHRRWAAAYLNMLETMMNLYFDKINCMDKTILKECYVKLLGLIVLARVDGKSPAEYITEELDKDILRGIAFQLTGSEKKCYQTEIKNILSMIEGEQP